VLINFIWGSFFQLKPSSNTTSATFCNFWLHRQLGNILSPIILAKIPCYNVLLNFLGGKIQIFGHFLSKNPIFSAFTFHKYHICSFLQLLSPHPFSGHIKPWNESKNSLLLCTTIFFLGKYWILVILWPKIPFLSTFHLS
jgi:hypothetical protein